MKSMRLFYISFILFFIVQCSMKAVDVRRGEYLELAKETSVQDFFEKRMKNRIKKVLGANWEILFESSEFIYFGYPLISFFREGTFLDEFFKVNKNQLESDFPTYKDFDGISMKKICYETLSEYKKKDLERKFFSMNCTASLEKDAILIYADWNYKIEEGKHKAEKYLIRFDKKNLKRESIFRLGLEE